MKVDLMGVQTINYTQKRTGKQASMCVLHRVHLRNGVAGCFVEEVRVYEGSDLYGLAASLLPGTVLDIGFDSRGFVTDILVQPDPFPAFSPVPDKKTSTK